MQGPDRRKRTPRGLSTSEGPLLDVGGTRRLRPLEPSGGRVGNCGVATAGLEAWRASSPSCPSFLQPFLGPFQDARSAWSSRTHEGLVWWAGEESSRPRRFSPDVRVEVAGEGGYGPRPFRTRVRGENPPRGSRSPKSRNLRGELTCRRPFG